MTLRLNQKKAIEYSLNNDFKSGVHFHATGTGKSWIGLELILRYFKYDYSLLLKIFSIIVTLHLFQQHESVNSRFQNFKNIQDNLVKERIFWKKVNDLNLTGYVLSNNPTCNKVIIHTKLPILFCFYMLDNLSYFPNLITPSKKITHDILDISFKDVKNRNLGGIIDPEIKRIYEEKSFENWKYLNDKFFFKYCNCT